MEENVLPLEPMVYTKIMQLRAKIYNLRSQAIEDPDLQAKLDDCWNSVADVMRNSGYPGKTISDFKLRLAKMQILEKKSLEARQSLMSRNSGRTFAEQHEAFNRRFARFVTRVNNIRGPITTELRIEMLEEMIGRENMRYVLPLLD